MKIMTHNPKREGPPTTKLPIAGFSIENSLGEKIEKKNKLLNLETSIC